MSRQIEGEEMSPAANHCRANAEALMMLPATLTLLPQGFREHLVQMSHEEFSNNTSSLAATYREPPKTLGEAAGRIWGEVGDWGPSA